MPDLFFSDEPVCLQLCDESVCSVNPDNEPPVKRLSSSLQVREESKQTPLFSARVNAQINWLSEELLILQTQT